MRKKLLFALLGWLPVACQDTSVRPPPSIVVAEFNPAATPPVVPTPTDLARDPTTGQIKIPLPPNASPAERDFAAYLESLDGFPPSSHAVATFSGPLDTATLRANTIIVLDLTAGAPIGDAIFQFNAQTLQINVVPRVAWPSGHTIEVIVRGGPDGVVGANGQQVVGSPAWFFARSTRPISNCTTPAPNCTSATPFIPVDQAIALEALRQQLAPLFAAAEAAGVPRDQVALAWTFTISNRAFTVFDPASQRIPFPNDIVRDPTTGKVNLPINPDDPVAMNAFKAELNQLSGFSTTGSILGQVDLPPGDALVPDTGAVVTTAQPTNINIIGGNIVITPIRPLAPEKLFLVVVTRRLVDTVGNPVEPAPLMVFLRDPNPLFDGTHSTVAELSDTDAQQLEPLRMALGQGLDLAGIPRENVILAWGFTTQPTVSVLQSRIAGLPPTSSMGAPTDIPPGIPRDRISAVLAGTFVGSKGDPVPTLLFLPTATPPRGLVIFQHGFPSDKRVAFVIANTFATLGLATAAMDLPLSGDRAVQGRAFLDLTDLGATRENLLEASADVAQLERTATTTGLFGNTFSGRPLFVGESAGGFVVTNYAAINPPPRLVQSTSGAPIVDIALTSPTFAPLVQQGLAAIGITPGTPQFDQYIYFARMELDAGDPINYAGLITPVRTAALAQVAPNDQVIPAPLGEKLGAATQARIVLLPAAAGHGALINPQDPTIATAQAQVAAFLLGGQP